jgi:hypothetical protein
MEFIFKKNFWAGLILNQLLLNNKMETKIFLLFITKMNKNNLFF